MVDRNYVKAFTLVELLAVIVLIGLIATITVPVISGVIENNKKQSIVINTEKTIKAIETYKTTYELETGRELKNTSYKIENKKVIGLDLSINGTLPESGEIFIDESGVITIYVSDSGYCASGKIGSVTLTTGECNVSGETVPYFTIENIKGSTDNELIVKINVANTSNLNSKAYSFDNGVTWQEDNTITISSSYNGTIKVRNTKNNERSQEYSVSKLTINANGWC